jgi:ATP adenylyltransferase
VSLDRLWAAWRSEYVSSAVAEERGAGERGCVFCRILASGEPDTVTNVVWRHPGGGVVAMLNAYPYASGHLMVMPVRHVGDLVDLDPAEAAAVWEGVSEGVGALRRAYDPDGVNVGANLGRAAGAGIPGHLHVHAVALSAPPATRSRTRCRRPR